MRPHFLLIILSIGLIHCNESDPVEEVCSECESASFVDSLFSERVQFFKYETQPSVETLQGPHEKYLICNAEVLSEIEDTKIIDLDGGVFTPCDSSDHRFLEISNFTVVETCLPVIDTLQGQSDLLGRWYFYEILAEGDSLTPPCISGRLFIEEREGRFYLFAQTHAGGGPGGEIMIEDQTITTVEITQTLIFPKTLAENEFDQAYCEVIVCTTVGTRLAYEMDRNFLTITNTLTEDRMEFFEE